MYDYVGEGALSMVKIECCRNIVYEPCCGRKWYDNNGKGTACCSVFINEEKFGMGEQLQRCVYGTCKEIS